jgi:hypothetical protein
VVFAGGEGSLLLMQADSRVAETSKLASTFIIASLESFDESLDSSSWCPFSVPAGRLRQRQISHAAVAARLRLSPHVLRLSSRVLQEVRGAGLLRRIQCWAPAGTGFTVAWPARRVWPWIEVSWAVRNSRAEAQSRIPPCVSSHLARTNA